MKKYKGKLIYLPKDKAYWLIDPIYSTNFLTQTYGPPNLLENLIKKRRVEVEVGKESYSIKSV